MSTQTVGATDYSIYGDLNGGQTVFFAAYKAGGSGMSQAVQALAAQATATVAQFAPHNPLPACSDTDHYYSCLRASVTSFTYNKTEYQD